MKRKEKKRKEKEKKEREKKKTKKKKEREKGLLYRILNLPRPPRPVLVQVGTTLDFCRVNRLGRYYPRHLQS